MERIITHGVSPARYKFVLTWEWDNICVPLDWSAVFHVDEVYGTPGEDKK
jgi:hypothetical protein